MRRARAESWLVVAGASIALSSCASYRFASLPDATVAGRRSQLDEPRLQVAVDELQRAGRTPSAFGDEITIDLSDGMNPDEAAVLAVLLNRGLVAARDAHGEAEAQITIAGILPNPVLGVGLSHPFGPQAAGTNEVLDLSLQMDLKPFVARSARRRAAMAGVQQVDLAIAWQEWQVAQEARLLVVRLSWLRKRVKLAREELGFLDQAAEAMAATTRAGDTTIEQAGVQRASLERVRRAFHQLEQAEVDSESALRLLLGNPSLGKLEVPDASSFVGGPIVAPSVDACLEGRLDLAALRRGYQAGEEQLRAAVLEQFPAVTIGVAYQHNEVALDFIGGFVNVELPVFNRNQGQVKLGAATRRRLAHEYDAHATSARGDLDRLLRFSALVARQFPEVSRSIAPLEDIELKERIAVARGDVSRLSYQIVRDALFEQRLQEAALSQALAEARIALVTTCGAEPGKQP